jgi:DNA polymerase III gamma/tau subunit
MPLRLLTYEETGLLLDRVTKRAIITISQEVKDELISACQGSPRMALVLLDKISNLSEDQRISAIQAKLTEEQESIEICRALLQKKSWRFIADLLQNIKADPEEVRYAVLGYARSVLLKSGDKRAAQIIDLFRDNFFDSKQAGLAFACFVATELKG